MSLLAFESPDPAPKGGKKSLKLVLGISALAGVVALGSTLAANINLNGGGNVEFGQGLLTTTACDDDGITVTPFSTFVNAQGAGEHKLTSISLSGIDSREDNCEGKTFRIRAYGDGPDPLNLFRWETGVMDGVTQEYVWTPADTYNFVDITRTDETFLWTSEGTDDDDVTGIVNFPITQTAFTLSLVSEVPTVRRVPLASAEDVKRITVETSGTTTATDQISISCESAPDDAPSFYPCGPQQNVPLSTLTGAGWEQCYAEDFGAQIPGDSIEPILNVCTERYLAFLGQETTGSTALLMAAAPRAYISLETPRNSPNSINGSWWYYTKITLFDQGSFGFAGSQTINQTSCDIGDDDATSDFRYCLHINQNAGGYRIGRIGGLEGSGLNNAPTIYSKVVYQHDGLY